MNLHSHDKSLCHLTATARITWESTFTRLLNVRDQYSKHTHTYTHTLTHTHTHIYTHRESEDEQPKFDFGLVIKTYGFQLCSSVLSCGPQRSREGVEMGSASDRIISTD